MSSPLGHLMEVARIQSEINRLFDNLLDLGKNEEVGTWNPNVDIVETESSLLLKVELPGVRAGELQLAVHGGNLILRG
jgi:HSP20 family molecular chaperone IbpA